MATMGMYEGATVERYITECVVRIAVDQSPNDTPPSLLSAQKLGSEIIQVINERFAPYDTELLETAIAQEDETYHYIEGEPENHYLKD